jgi:hypothetical protein
LQPQSKLTALNEVKGLKRVERDIVMEKNLKYKQEIETASLSHLRNQMNCRKQLSITSFLSPDPTVCLCKSKPISIALLGGFGSASPTYYYYYYYYYY